MASSEYVRGILVDGSLLISENNENAPTTNLTLNNGAHSLLTKLRYSNLHTGICYGMGLSAQKAHFLESTAKQYSFRCFVVNASSMADTINEITIMWHGSGGRFLYIASSYDEELLLELSSHNWQLIILGSKSDSLSSNILSVEKLEEVPFTICRLNRKAKMDNHVTIGYFMKPSREEDFAKRGAFPWCPNENGLMFMPLTFELPISVQLQEIDIVLHKATDEIVSLEKSTSAEFFDRITYTRGMQELKKIVENRPNICIIDPFSDIFPVVDRLKTQQILLGLEDLDCEGHLKIRGPHFLKVDNFDEPDLVLKLVEAKLTLPAIVKPQVACGVADAHSMAIVFTSQDFNGLGVPLPAVIQEYVNHSSTLYKFYVLGEKVFYAVKKSTPNSDRLQEFFENNGFKPLLFDSLKSLPTDKENQHSGKEDNQNIDLELVTKAAFWLRRKINLTIFGFDVVIQEGTCDYVIVDVNYLPSFKEVPDSVAIPAFWEAIRTKYNCQKT